MIIIFKIFFVIFVSFIIYNFIFKKRKQKTELKKIFIWLIFWIVALMIIIWPDITSIFAKAIGIGRGSDLILYVSVIVIFFLIFKMYLRIEIINSNITKITRKIAMTKSIKSK